MPKLSFRNRFRLAWELTWPLTLMDVLVAFMIHGVLDAPGETLDSIWAVVAFFVASPWVIRRAFRKQYSGYLIETQKGPLNYQQSLKVMWLLAWRSTVLMLLAAIAISGVLRLAGWTPSNLAAPGPLANALGLSALDAMVSLVFTPFLIPGMLRKRYRGFYLVLSRHVGEPAPSRK